MTTSTQNCLFHGIVLWISLTICNRKIFMTIDIYAFFHIQCKDLLILSKIILMCGNWAPKQSSSPMRDHVTWTYKCRLRGLRASPFQHPWGVGPSQLILFLQSQYPESQHLAQDLTKLLLVSSGLKTEPSAAPCPPTSPSTSSCSPACSPSHTGWMTQKLCDSLEKYTPVLLRMSGLMQSHQGAFALPCSSPTTTTCAWSSWSSCAELQVT